MQDRNKSTEIVKSNDDNNQNIQILYPPASEELKNRIERQRTKDKFYNIARNLHGYTNYDSDEDLFNKNGCAIYWMKELPAAIDKSLNNSYLFAKKSSKLFYISEGQAKEVNINDMEKFVTSLTAIMKPPNLKYSRKHLNNQEIYQLITVNGGHHPAKREDQLNTNQIAIQQEKEKIPQLKVKLFPDPQHVLPTHLFNENNIDFQAAKKNASRIISFLEKNSDHDSLFFENITKQHAFLILKNTHDALQLTGTVHFPSLKRILFQYNETNYILKYVDENENAECYFMRMSPFTFDIEKGLKSLDTTTPVMWELQWMFEDWKESGSKGDIISFANSGFREIKINNIASIQDIGSLLLEREKREHFLYNFDGVQSYLLSLCKKLEIDIKNFNFFEHCLLYAAGCLPLSENLSKCIDFFFEENKSAQVFPYPVISLWYGIPDNKLNQSDLCHELSNLDQIFFENLLNLHGDFATRPTKNKYFKRINPGNMQYDLALNQRRSVEAVIKNPLSIALFLIENEHKISNKEFVSDACGKLTQQINLFRGIFGGVPDMVLDKLIDSLAMLHEKCMNPSPIHVLIQSEESSTSSENKSPSIYRLFSHSKPIKRSDTPSELNQHKCCQIM